MEPARKRRSVVWSYFSTTTKGKAMCSVCEKEVPHGSNTSNLFKHLKTTHPDTFQEAEHRYEDQLAVKASAVRPKKEKSILGKRKDKKEEQDSSHPVPDAEEQTQIIAVSPPWFTSQLSVVTVEVHGPPSSSQQTPSQPASIVDHCAPLELSCSPQSCSSTSPNAPEAANTPLNSAPLPPDSLPSVPNVDPISFWQACNQAGCVQEIFNDFICELSNIACRIQTGEADEDDCDLALKAMAASGKLAELLNKQQRELEKKQEDLHNAASGMRTMLSALK